MVQEKLVRFIIFLAIPGTIVALAAYLAVLLPDQLAAPGWFRR